MENPNNKNHSKRFLRAALRILLTVLGGALTAESIFAFRYANTRHFGIYMALIIGLPLLLIGIFYPQISKLCRKSRIARVLKWAIIAAYGLFALLFAFTTAAIGISANASEGKKPDVIIVLGAGIIGSRPTATLTYRLEKALEYYRQDPELTLIVSGGKGGDEQFTEAEVMRAWLVENGVDPERIILEDRSESTEENFVFSGRLIDEAGGGQSVAFVTSRFHVFRAGRIAKKLGIKAFGIPALEYRPLALNDYLRECAAIVQYFLSGRI